MTNPDIITVNFLFKYILRKKGHLIKTNTSKRRHNIHDHS